MANQQAIELVTKIYEAFNRRDLDALDEYLAPDYEDYSVGTPYPTPFDRETLKELLTIYFNAFPDAQFAASDFITEGDKIAWRDHLTGTHTGEMMGIPPTGRKVDVWGMGTGEMRDGKACRHYSVFDNLGLMQQIGVIPVPGQQPEPVGAR